MPFIKKILFLGFENTFATTTEGRGSPIPRTGSPERTASPARVLRAMSPTREVQISASDVDPEAVRMALRDFVNQLANAERERVITQYLFLEILKKERKKEKTIMICWFYGKNMLCFHFVGFMLFFNVN